MENLDPGKLRDAWNADYKRRGRLYGGAPLQLPDIAMGARILDLGCGDGKHLAAMEARGWRVVGIDFSEEAVRICNQRGRALLIGDASSLPFRDGSCDAAIGLHILGHLPGQYRLSLIHEVWRVLVPGGLFYSAVFSQRDMRCGKGEEVEPFTYNRQGIITHYFSEDELAGLKGPFEKVILSRESRMVRLSGEWHMREHLFCTFIR